MKQLTRKYLKTNGDYPGYSLLLAVADYFKSKEYAVTIAKDKPKVFSKKEFEAKFSTINALNSLGQTYWNVNCNVDDKNVTILGVAESPFITFLTSDDFDFTDIAEYVKIYCSNAKKMESRGLLYNEI